MVIILSPLPDFGVCESVCDLFAHSNGCYVPCAWMTAPFDDDYFSHYSVSFLKTPGYYQWHLQEIKACILRKLSAI